VLEMTSSRPAPVLYTAAWQILLGLIYLYRAYQLGHPVAWLFFTGYGLYHAYTAYGLYLLREAARQRAVQMAVFDIFALLQMLFPYPNPFGALFNLGMPLYTITVLTDRRVRLLFS